MLRLALLSILATVAFSQVPCGTYVHVLLAGGSCGAVTVLLLSPPWYCAESPPQWTANYFEV